MWYGRAKKFISNNPQGKEVAFLAVFTDGYSQILRRSRLRQMQPDTAYFRVVQQKVTVIIAG
jgi:hypothetical protein